MFGEHAWQRYDPEQREWSGHISGPLVETISAAAPRVFPDRVPTPEEAAAILAQFKKLCGASNFISAILTATQTVNNVRVRMESFEGICRDAE